jgi:hypothetical protein
MHLKHEAGKLSQTVRNLPSLWDLMWPNWCEVPRRAWVVEVILCRPGPLWWEEVRLRDRQSGELRQPWEDRDIPEGAGMLSSAAVHKAYEGSHQILTGWTVHQIISHSALPTISICFLFFVFFFWFETGSHYAAQVGLKLLGSRDSPASASQEAGS